MKAEVYDRLLDRIVHYGNASTFALRKAAARMERYSPRQAKAFLGEAYYDRGRLIAICVDAEFEIYRGESEN